MVGQVILNEYRSSNQIEIGVIISYLSIGINIIARLLYTPWIVDII